MRIDSSGRVGIGTTSPTTKLNIVDTSNPAPADGGSVIIEGRRDGNANLLQLRARDASDPNTALPADQGAIIRLAGFNGSAFGDMAGIGYLSSATLASGNTPGILTFYTTPSGSSSLTERARIDSSGRVLVGTTSTNLCSGNVAGIGFSTTSDGTFAAGAAQFSCVGGAGLNVNRNANDGNLVNFFQDGTLEGSISVSGTTVSYNGGHLSRWAQMPGTKDDTLVKGTVMSNLDEMNVYTKDGEAVENEQLNKVKVSNVEGDVNVAGVFVNWTYDDAHQVDEINMAMTGDMIIRIAQGVVVQKGDLLMSAGDGTAKPQDDDIVHSKTVAKVTSNHVTCTYEDGSYCVPCVLMAC
jgi:hypothetical protein